MALHQTVIQLAKLTPQDCATAGRPQTASASSAAINAGAPADERAPEDRNAVETSRQACVTRAIRRQRAEIVRHRDIMARQLGRFVTLDEAARDWIPRFAAEWRARNGAKMDRRASER